MTAPAVKSLQMAGLPTWDIDDGALRIVHGNCLDELGRRWTVDKHPDGEKGWAPSTAPRTQRSDRPNGHGEFRGVAWRKGRAVSLSGKVLCPTPAIREQTEVELAALCSDPGRLYSYRRTTEVYDQAIEVELDADPSIEVVTLRSLAWRFEFYAVDPRKHDWAWQEPVTTVPTTSTGGADFDNGLDFDGGADFGTAARPQSARVTNRGTAPVHPIFALVGPLSAPTVRQVETGLELPYRGDIAAGETVWINCDVFTALGVPGHARLSSLRGNVGSLVPVASAWPRVEPHSTSRFVLQANGGEGSAMRTYLRQCWW